MNSRNALQNRTIQKLRKRSGETLTETLVALLIAALALTMLAGAISASSGIVTKSRNTLDAYYSLNESTVVGMNSTDDDVIQQAKISFTQVIEDDSVSMGPIPSFNVTCYKNATFSNSPVIAYKIADEP